MTEFKRGDRVFIAYTSWDHVPSCSPGNVARVLKTFVEVRCDGRLEKFDHGGQPYPRDNYPGASIRTMEPWSKRRQALADRQEAVKSVQADIRSLNVTTRDRLSGLPKPKFEALAAQVSRAAELLRACMVTK